MLQARRVHPLGVGALVGVVVLLVGLLTFGWASAAGGKPVEPPTADPSNSRLGVTLGADGRFSAGAFPNPDGSPGASSYKLLYGWPSTGTSYTTIRSDGADLVFGSGAGTFTQSPNGGGAADDVSVWKSGDLTVTQTIGLAANPQTGKDDAARISYKITNTGTTPHAVGSRVMLDTDVNDNDGAPYRVAGIGPLTTERDFQGAAVPSDFSVFQNLSDSAHIAGAVLRGAGATAPDRLVIGRWRGLQDSPWDYTVDPAATITGDSAYAAYWNPANLPAGQSRTYTTFYGLGDVTVDLTPPVAVGLTGPTSLTATSTGYTPNPFAVTATLSTATDAPASNVTARLNLPAGLTTRDPQTVAVGNLAPGSAERALTWNVTAAPQARATSLTYSVTVTAAGAPDKTISRTISVPASSSATQAKNIVSLGDSYSSGEGAASASPGDRRVDYDSGTATATNQCHRAETAWPRLLGVPADRHFACSGALSTNLIESGPNDDAKTSQITRLGEVEKALARRSQHVDVVTVTMSGNDLGFSSLLRSCFYVNSCLNNVGQDQKYFQPLQTRMTWVVNAIKQAAPRAKVVLVGYPRLFPAADQTPVNCGWLTTEERGRANNLASQLDQFLAKVPGVTYVSVLNSMDRHELCTADPYLVSLATPDIRAHFYEQGHPRSRGQAKIADLVRPAIS